jgi:FKBP-type peptidyl-prolyl cis-trans isomerase FklB
MKNGMRIVLAAGLGLALLQPRLQAQDKSELKDQKEKLSYGIGFYFGNQITNAVKRSNFDVDYNVLMGAIKDILTGKEVKMTEAQAREVITVAQKEIRAKMEEERKKAAEKNRKAGEAFLAENAKKPGVKTKMVDMPDGTKAELQYKVLKEGTGATPKATDIVSFNYRGTLIDGKEFDSSAKHGAPLKQPVTQLIRGWTEALQMMKAGSKWELYIPASLAYGDMPRPGIDPGSTLIFEVELLSAESPPPAPTPQPLTSDIIKVPSAEELKKGAKIEVLKPEEAAKAAQQAAGKTNASK